MYQFSDPNSSSSDGNSNVKKHAFQNELAMIEADLKRMMREKDDAEIELRRKKKDLERATIELQASQDESKKLSTEIFEAENRIRELRKKIDTLMFSKN